MTEQPLIDIEVRLGSRLKTPGSTRQHLEVDEGATVAALRSLLTADDPILANALETALAVVRGRVVTPDTQLTKGDTVTFVLPTAGG